MRLRILASFTATISFAAAFLFAAPSPVHAAAGPRVAIIVGPVGASLTPTYIQWADETAAAATAAGAYVVKAYSPNASAANVLNAINGANIIVYYGHGSGFPNPYSTTLDPNSVNGWGLQGPNARGTHEDSWSNGTLRYYGEAWIAANAHPAPGFVMVYSNACYAPGASEGWDTPATESVAKARVGYYSRAPLNMGASAYFATDIGAAGLVTRIITQRSKTFGDIFKAEPKYVATALRTLSHPNVTGQQVWLHKAANWSGEVGYWYAYAGNPTVTPAAAGMPVPVDQPPSVVGRSPVANATNVALSAVPQVQFSEPVTGVTSSTFRVRDTVTGALVPATVTYDAARRIASLYPSAPFLLGRQYKLGAGGSIRDAAGQAMPEWSIWYFTTTTGDTTPPKVTYRGPVPGATGVAVWTHVQVNFSEAVTGVTTSTFRVRDTVTGAIVPASVTYDAATRSALLVPSAPLVGGREYKAGVGGSIRDLSGNAMSSWSIWYFTTAP
ncbi:MAG: Ig-like domain-containing protein [Chloroflexota bacterium]|nr:Ig-like domain-containing protein [Chloroflexota bacterium]